jgi:acetyl esterase/lipase
MSRIRERIDPELARALEAVPGPKGIFDLTDIQTTREGVRKFAQQIAAQSPDFQTIAVAEFEATGDHGHAVPIRFLRPIDSRGPFPLLVWFHGGGQILGDAAEDDPKLKKLVSQIRCAVAAVDYRLAPEALSPAGAEDAAMAFQWLVDNASLLDIDRDRISIAGASGGGCVAAASILMLRDRGRALPLFQALHYPMLDDRNQTPSSHEITDIGIWDRDTNVLAWKTVLGKKAGSDDVSPYSAPARVKDVSRLPRTFLAVGELDLFRDEALAYALRLQACDVPVELHLYPGAFHAFDLFAPQSRFAASFNASWYAFLKRLFELS